jgi:hypothetical protein
MGDGLPAHAEQLMSAWGGIRVRRPVQACPAHPAVGTTEDGAFMEPRGRNLWQPVASVSRTEPVKNKPKPLPSVATDCQKKRMVSALR